MLDNLYDKLPSTQQLCIAERINEYNLTDMTEKELEAFFSVA